MLSVPGCRIGDAWYFQEADTVHAFFLVMPTGQEFGWDIGHAVSEDLVRWEYLGLALRRGAAGSWDDRNLATGSVIHWRGRYWMGYTGHKMDEVPFTQRVGVAVSDDLANWDKLPENPTTEAAAPLYEPVSSGHRTASIWRDPFLFDTGEEVIQYVCARRTDGDVSDRGTLGLARTRDMRTWELMPPPDHDRVADELEVPQVHRIDSLYYLVFCTHPKWLAPAFRERFPGHAFRSTDYSMVGESPLGPFRVHGTGEITPAPPDYHQYAGQLVHWGGDWFLLGTARDDSGWWLTDPKPVRADDTGVHA